MYYFFNLSVQALADIVQSHLQSEQCVSTQLSLQCPGCINIHCQKMRQFFMSQQPLLDTMKEETGQEKQKIDQFTN